MEIFELSVGRHLLKAIFEKGMPHDYSFDEEWVLAREIENNIRTSFCKINKNTNGPPIKIIMNNMKSVVLLKSQLEDLQSTQSSPEYNNELKRFKIYLSGSTSFSKQADRDLFFATKEKAEMIVSLTLKECSNIFKTIIPELPENWSPKITCDWDINRKNSWGGFEKNTPDGIFGQTGGVNIAMRTIINKQGDVFNKEYHEHPSLDNHVEMGGFTTNKWGLQLIVLSCHVASHAAQDYYMSLYPKEEYKQSHGLGFQRLYLATRRKLCNQRLKKEI